MGKSMGNGHPVSAVLTSRAIARAYAEGPLFFSTVYSFACDFVPLAKVPLVRKSHLENSFTVRRQSSLVRGCAGGARRHRARASQRQRGRSGRVPAQAVRAARAAPSLHRRRSVGHCFQCSQRLAAGEPRLILDVAMGLCNCSQGRRLLPGRRAGRAKRHVVSGAGHRALRACALQVRVCSLSAYVAQRVTCSTALRVLL